MLSTEQKTSQLYKHFLNVSDTRDSRDFYEEAIQSSFCIRPDQLLMYGDEIPRGTDERTVNIIRNLKDGEYYDWQKDETTIIHIVQYHENYPLQKIDDGTDNAFKLVDENGNPIQNIIPFNYYRDLYNYDLRTNHAHGNKKIYFGVGDWVLDTYSGVLKFYGDVPDGIDHNNPPTISFYQYVGGTGFRQDTFGYDGVIVPIKNWHISAGSYLIDGTNTKDDGALITLEEQISNNANVIQDGYTGTFGFDGADKNEGVAYSLQKIISLTYATSLDNVKGYDESSDTDIGTLLSRKKATLKSNKELIITFCSQNVSVNTDHRLVVVGNTLSFDGGDSKTIDGITKLNDNNGNFIIVESSKDNLTDGDFEVIVVEDTTVGIMLYWNKLEKDYVPFINKEDDDFNFGFPVVAANGRIPPSVSIGAVSLNDYTDSITPEYYGPRNYTVTVAVDKGSHVKSADYLVGNNEGHFLDDILKRIISDYTKDGIFNFTGSIFLRSGKYLLSKSSFNLNDFSKLNLIGEDKYTTIIDGGLSIESQRPGYITLSNLTFNNNITFKSSALSLSLNEIIGKNFLSSKNNNVLFIKNSSFENLKITNSGTRLIEYNSNTVFNTSSSSDSSSISDSSSNSDSSNNTDIEAGHIIYNHISGSTIGYVSIETGHTFISGDIIGILKLHDVEDDFVKSSFIQIVKSKPHQTTIIGSTVFTYENTPFVEVPHMKHFPIYSKSSDQVLEYATFDNPFRINYSQSGNKITIALDDEYLYINDKGELSCNLNAGSIIVDVNQLHRNPNYEGTSPVNAIPNKNLQETLNDIYSTKADLNPNGKLPLEELPDSVAYGGLLFVGTWSFEYKDIENGKPQDNYYVDGGKYPAYEDAIKNLTVDKTQDEGLEPGWFWIVSSSRKDDDKPAAKQKSFPQKIKDLDGNVIYEDDGLVYTAGDWVIWNGTNFEKLDRAYQDAAYAVLPIYTTGEHLCWSWISNEDGKKWGLGALELGGETIAESFDMINQELRKLWVKHPAVLRNITLEPFYNNYKILDFYPIEGNSVSKILRTAYDMLKDIRTKDFRVRTPETNPTWKSGIFVGERCTLTAAVDGVPTTIEYTPTSTDVTKDQFHISAAFDPFDTEISGSNYWKAVYMDFGGKNFNEGTHKFMLSMSDITPNNNFTNDAISSTPVFGIDTVEKYDFNINGFIATLDEKLITLNGADITAEEIKGYCSGVPNITKDINLRFGFTVNDAIDCVNTDRVFIQMFDNSNNIIQNIPESNAQFILDKDTGLYSIRVRDFNFNLIASRVFNKQTYTLNLYDVYKNKKSLSDFLSTNIRVSPGLNENERVRSGDGIYPTVDTERSTTCGYLFDSSRNLKEDYKNELMKSSRNNGDIIVHEYHWPDKNNISYTKTVDYTDTETCDVIESDVYNGKYRWVTLTQLWNGDSFENVYLTESSGFTLDINVSSDMQDNFNLDMYSMSTSPDNFIIMAKLVDFSLTNDCGLTSWFDCNRPYDGFAKVGTENGQPAMYAGSSTKFSKRITFGTSTYSGQLIFRIGIKKDSNLSFQSLSVRDLI